MKYLGNGEFGEDTEMGLVKYGWGHKKVRASGVMETLTDEEKEEIVRLKKEYQETMEYYEGGILGE